MGSGAVSPVHLVILLVIVLLVFGPGKLPELGAAVGKTMREFRQAMDGVRGTAVTTDEPPAIPSSADQRPPSS